MQLQEDKIVEKFAYLLIRQVKMANEKLVVKLQSDGHKVFFICDDKNNEKECFSFFG